MDEMIGSLGFTSNNMESGEADGDEIGTRLVLSWRLVMWAKGHGAPDESQVAVSILVPSKHLPMMGSDTLPALLDSVNVFSPLSVQTPTSHASPPH